VSRKMGLDQDGVVGWSRMTPFNPSAMNRKPAQKVSRLKQLLKSHRPDICIIRGEGIGDVIMALPTVAAVKETFKGKCRITFATNTTYLDGALVKILRGNPDIEKVIDRKDCKEDDYDLVIDLHCPAIHYEKPGCRPLNRIDIFANHAGVQLKQSRPRVYITEEEIEHGADLLRHLSNKKKVMVQLFASSSRRSLSTRVLKEALTELYNRHGICSVILTHSSDPQIDVRWQDIPGVEVLADKDVREIAGAMVHCDLVLCPDSSILHLAGALSVPVVGIFGPTDPAARVNHYPSAVAIWGGDGLKPCPCWYTDCPINYICWDKIDTETIISACVNHMGTSKKVEANKIKDGGSHLIEIRSEVL